MKKYFILSLLLIPTLTFAALPPDNNSSGCGKVSVVEGDSSNIIGCGIATTFGHKTDGSKDGSPDDGNVFCNTSNDKSKYTYRSDRSTQQNLQVKFAALRINDIKKIFKISGKLSKNRSKFCGKMIKVKDLNTGKDITVPLMDIMSNNNKVIDLTGGAMKELGGKGKEPTLGKVQITWADQPAN